MKDVSGSCRNKDPTNSKLQDRRKVPESRPLWEGKGAHLSPLLLQESWLIKADLDFRGAEKELGLGQPELVSGLTAGAPLVLCPETTHHSRRFTTRCLKAAGTSRAGTEAWHMGFSFCLPVQGIGGHRLQPVVRRMEAAS